MWKWAQEYTLADHFFMGAFGGSYLNHFWLICACTPRDAECAAEHARAGRRARLAQDARRTRRRRRSPAPPEFVGGEVTPDGYSVNTTQPPYQPSRVPPAKDGDPRFADPAKHTLPPQTQKTIGDTLSAKGVSWAWYAGAWNAAVKDGMQPPDAPSARSSTTRDNGRAVLRHASPAVQLFRALRAGHRRPRAAPQGLRRSRRRHRQAATCRAVAFYKPQGTLNEHPGYADVLSGDVHIAELVGEDQGEPAVGVDGDHRHLRRERRLLGSRARRRKGDRWGPGTRIPAIIISPFAKRGYVDHTSYDTTSILKFITLRFGLEPLPGVRAGAGDLTAAFDFAP